MAVKNAIYKNRHLKPGTVRYGKVILGWVRQATGTTGEKCSVYRLKCEHCAYIFEAPLSKLSCQICKGKKGVAKIHTLPFEWIDSTESLPGYNAQVIAACSLNNNVTYGTALFNTFNKNFSKSVSLANLPITHWFDFKDLEKYLPRLEVTKPLIDVDEFREKLLDSILKVDPILHAVFKTAEFRLRLNVLDIRFAPKHKFLEMMMSEQREIWAEKLEELKPDGLVYTMTFIN